MTITVTLLFIRTYRQSMLYSIGGGHVGVVTFPLVHGEVLCKIKDRLYVNAVCMKTMVKVWTFEREDKKDFCLPNIVLSSSHSHGL